MKNPAASDWLDVWGRAIGATPAQRPLLLLEARHGADARPESWPLGLREAALLELRTLLFGDGMECLCGCPECGAAVEFSLQADDLISLATEAGIQSPLCVAAAGCEASFRLPDTCDIEAAGRMAPAQRRGFLLARCLSEGDPPQGGWPEEFVATAARQMGEADPLGDLSLGLSCPECQHTWEALVDAGSFLWAEIHAWASRLMEEIHVLASAYGWTEGEILALPPQRRRFYLECLARRAS